MNRLLEINSCKNRAWLGCRRLARTKERIKRIRERIRRNPQRSANKIAAEENMSRRTSHVTLNEDLGFRLSHKKSSRFD